MKQARNINTLETLYHSVFFKYMFCFLPVLKPDTPRKIHIEPENDALEDDFPFPGVYSQVPAVNPPGCTLSSKKLPQALFRFLDLFFGEMTSVVFDANLRAVRPGQRTGFHTDSAPW